MTALPQNVAADILRSAARGLGSKPSGTVKSNSLEAFMQLIPLRLNLSVNELDEFMAAPTSPATNNKCNGRDHLRLPKTAQKKK